MKIKKLAAAVMTGVMVLGMGTSVYAASSSTITNPGGATAPQNVQATYQASAPAETVHSVDIEWGDLQYTYAAPSAGTWNPETHSYDGAQAGTWRCEENADKIKVTNHSNTAVKAIFSYAPDQAYGSITGEFDMTEVDLKTAVGTAVENAPTHTATLSLNGALNKNVPAATTIGTVTVSLGDIR